MTASEYDAVVIQICYLKRFHTRDTNETLVPCMLHAVTWPAIRSPGTIRSAVRSFFRNLLQTPPPPPPLPFRDEADFRHTFSTCRESEVSSARSIYSRHLTQPRAALPVNDSPRTACTMLLMRCCLLLLEQPKTVTDSQPASLVRKLIFLPHPTNYSPHPSPPSLSPPLLSPSLPHPHFISRLQSSDLP